MATAANSQSLNTIKQLSLHQELEDDISGDLMTRAVTVVPCGHVFNEDTVIQLLTNSKLCPLDRKTIEQHVPNYKIRSLAERVKQGLNGPQEEIISEDARRHFLRGKELADQGDKEKAILAFLKALQLSPSYEKAQGYLEFCLGVPSSNSSAQAASSQSTKDQYSELLIRLLDNASIQQNSDLLDILESQFDELMSTSSPTLNQKSSEMYLLIQKLLVDGKVSQFVAKKLSQLNAQPQQQAPLAQAALPPPQLAVSSSAEKELREFVKQNAFGKNSWMSYFGSVGIEPLPPLNIPDIWESPCPFWPGKSVKQTHMFVLIPETVGGDPLTLKTLGDFIQKPRLGNPNRYDGFDLGSYRDAPTLGCHWALITCEPIPGTEGKSYQEQQQVLAKYSKNAQAPYEVSNILDTTVSIFMSNLSKPGKSLPTYSRCKEEHSSGAHLYVGVLEDRSISIGSQSPRLTAPSFFSSIPAPIFVPVNFPPFVPSPGFEKVCDPELKQQYESGWRVIERREELASHCSKTCSELRNRGRLVYFDRDGRISDVMYPSSESQKIEWIKSEEEAEKSHKEAIHSIRERMIRPYERERQDYEKKAIERKREYEEQVNRERIREAEYKKQLEEHLAAEKKRESDYLLNQKKYEKDQKTYAAIGIRAQFIL